MTIASALWHLPRWNAYRGREFRHRVARFGRIHAIAPVTVKLSDQDIWRSGEIAVAGPFVAVYGRSPFVTPIELVCHHDDARVLATMHHQGCDLVDLLCGADLYELTFVSPRGDEFVRAMHAIRQGAPRAAPQWSPDAFAARS